MGQYDMVYALATDNVASSPTWAQATGTLNTLYPLSRLYDLDPGTHTKSTTTTEYRLTADFGAAQRLDAMWIPMSSMAGGTFPRWEGNATDSWGGPSHVSTITVNSPIGGIPRGIYCDLTQGAGYSAGGFRWWSLVVPNPGRITTIGEIFLSPTKRTAPNLFMGLNRARDRNVTLIPRDDGGEFGYDRGSDVLDIVGQVRLNSTTYQKYEEMWGAAKGRYSYFPVTIDTHLANPEGLFVKWQGPLSIVHTTSRHRMMEARWRMAGRGRAT